MCKIQDPTDEGVDISHANQVLLRGEMKISDMAVDHCMFKLFSSGSGGLSLSDGIEKQLVSGKTPPASPILSFSLSCI